MYVAGLAPLPLGTVRSHVFTAAEGDFSVSLPHRGDWRFDEEHTDGAAYERIRLVNPTSGGLVRIVDDPHPKPEQAPDARAEPVFERRL